jgi:hypothetical protein
MAPPPWSDKEVADLKRLLEDGKRYREIAEIIVKPHQAVAAKASRLGFRSNRLSMSQAERNEP